jgi:hypothetical protein
VHFCPFAAFVARPFAALLGELGSCLRMFLASLGSCFLGLGLVPISASDFGSSFVEPASWDRTGVWLAIMATRLQTHVGQSASSLS